MLAEHDLSLLREPTLQNRHMAGLSLSTRQMHVWCELLGVGGDDRQEGKWRGFAPLDAMILYVMRDIKARTNVALAKQNDLIQFLGDAERFGGRVFRTWTLAKTPILVTDCCKKHDVLEASGGAIPLSPEALRPLLVVLNLEPSLRSVFESILAGGTDEQKALVHRMMGRREAAFDASSQSASVPEPTASSARLSTGKRRLDPESVLPDRRT